MRIGEMEILPVHDGTARMKPEESYVGKGSTDDVWEGHRNLLDANGNIEMAMGGFLVRGGGDRVVLIDTGVGTINGAGFFGPEFRSGMFLESLAAHGVRPDDVTDVLFTHLHFDHVGWSTQKGRVVFPRATYRCDTRDWAHFVGPDPGATKKLSPLEGQLEPWDGSGTVLPGIDLQAAPGHTPGSTVVVVSSGSERAVLLGDAVHGPVELVDEEWGTIGDVDPELAVRTRNALARELEGTDTPVVAAHFPGLEFGRLLAGSGRRQWVFGSR